MHRIARDEITMKAEAMSVTENRSEENRVGVMVISPQTLP